MQQKVLVLSGHLFNSWRNKQCLRLDVEQIKFIIAITLSIVVLRWSLSFAHNTVWCTIQCRVVIWGATVDQREARPLTFPAMDGAPYVTSMHMRFMSRSLSSKNDDIFSNSISPVVCPSNGNKPSSSSLKTFPSKKRTYMQSWAVSVLSVDSSTATAILSAFLSSFSNVSKTSVARRSTLRQFKVSDRGTYLIADVTLVSTLSSVKISSTTANMQSFTVSETVNGLFFFAKIHDTRREAAVALSWAVQVRFIVVQLRL